jgi:hypothetical protein
MLFGEEYETCWKMLYTKTKKFWCRILYALQHDNSVGDVVMGGFAFFAADVETQL